MPPPRILLRPWSDADVEAFHSVWGDPEVVFWGPAASVEESLLVLRRVRARCEGGAAPIGWHAVVEPQSGEIVGNVLLQPAPFEPGALELGWHLRRDRWGRGYATEAARQLAAEAFATLEVRELVCAILPANLRSQAVARRLGATVHRRDVPHGGMPHDVRIVRAPAPA